MEQRILALQCNSPSKGMRRAMKQDGRRPSGGAAGKLLASSRWEELDWDKEGFCSFQHFILAFVQWVTVRHEVDSEESKS